LEGKQFENRPLDVPVHKYYCKVARMTQYPATEVRKGGQVKLHTFSSFALDRGDWSASCSGDFTLMKISPSRPIECEVGWMNLTASGAEPRRKIPTRQESNP
jgi:hypothetical protein